MLAVVLGNTVSMAVGAMPTLREARILVSYLALRVLIMNKGYENKKAKLLAEAKKIQRRSGMFVLKTLVCIILGLTAVRFFPYDFDKGYVFITGIFLGFMLIAFIMDELKAIHKLLAELIEFMCE